ncbi:hypothetical protein LCGC14_0578280 [marine sediment metagenome]|uniref:Uncharacterized protein n=1 Tax=marine sediment metagenome TaxID=412755 RepID=A0A0F9S0T5_9ZZZZ
MKLYTQWLLFSGCDVSKWRPNLWPDKDKKQVNLIAVHIWRFLFSVTWYSTNFGFYTRQEYKC